MIYCLLVYNMDMNFWGNMGLKFIAKKFLDINDSLVLVTKNRRKLLINEMLVVIE